MRRLIAVLMLMMVGFTASAQDEVILKFEVHDIQRSPDGRYALFSIWTSEPEPYLWPPYKEHYLVDLNTGLVFPLALQPNGPLPCFTIRRAGDYDCLLLGRPVFLPDGSAVVWGDMGSEEVDGQYVFRAMLSWYDIESQHLFTDANALLYAFDSYAMRLTEFHAGTRAEVFIVAPFYDHIDGPRFFNRVRVYDFADGSNAVTGKSYFTFEVAMDTNEDFYPSVWLWVGGEDAMRLAAAGTDGLWYIYDVEAKTVTATANAPVANAGDETMTYVWLPESDTNSSARWELTVEGSAGSPDVAEALIREYTNSDAADRIHLALWEALDAEFGQTGFSLRPRMTAVFDELRIYENLGVSREDTLLAPLEWRLAQPPEGETRSLDVEEIFFPGVG